MQNARRLEELSYEIVVWTDAGRLEEVLATAGNLQIAVAAYLSRPPVAYHFCRIDRGVVAFGLHSKAIGKTDK